MIHFTVCSRNNWKQSLEKVCVHVYDSILHSSWKIAAAQVSADGRMDKQSSIHTGFPGVSIVKNCLPLQETQETWVQSLSWEDPLEEEMAAHSSILARRIHGQRSLEGYSLMGLQRVRHELATEHICSIYIQWKTIQPWKGREFWHML